MKATRKFIQIVRFALAASVVMYFFVILRLPSSATPKPIIHRALTMVCITLAIVIFVVRKKFVTRAEDTLQRQPQDATALARWRVGYIVIYAVSLSIALYGLVLHFMGFPMSAVFPFFLAGLALILFFRPMAIPQNTAFTEQSGPITPRSFEG